MRTNIKVNSISLSVITGASALFLALGGCANEQPRANVNDTPTPTPTLEPTPPEPVDLPSPTPTPTQKPVPKITREIKPPKKAQTATQQTASIYLLKDTGKNFELVAQPVKVSAKQPEQVLEGAFQNLLSTQPQDSASSTIPPGTKLRSVKIENDGIHVDLSQEFTSGGGSASMSGRVGQVVYTATSLQPDAKVWIEVEGKKLEVLGGEGLELQQPMTRTSFKENFPL